jgi:hydrogenase maturation protease
MKRTVILGLGDDLFADEGFGMRVVESLHAQYVFPENVKLIDGGVEGADFLAVIEDADILLIVDALDSALKPDVVSVLDGGQIAGRIHGCENSLHQIDFVAALRQARKEGRLPARIRFIGVQQQAMETYGNPVSEPGRVQVETAVVEIVNFLVSNGVVATPRPSNMPVEPLEAPVIDPSEFGAGCFA